MKQMRLFAAALMCICISGCSIETEDNTPETPQAVQATEAETEQATEQETEQESEQASAEETTTAEETVVETSAEEITTAEETEKAAEPAFPQEYAFRAAVVCMTNDTALDVFTDDGIDYDTSKFHSYSDKSGDVYTITDSGAWTEKDGGIWHVDGLKLYRDWDGIDITADVNMDVSYDGENYVISNVTGRFQNYGIADEYQISSVAMTVPFELIKDDR